MKEEKPKKKEETPEMKELKEKEKALVKVQQPDRTELDANAEKLQTEINGMQEKLKALNERISAKSAGKEEHFKARDEIRQQLDSFQSKIDALEKRRNELQGNIQSKQKESRDKRNELNDMKKRLGFDSEADIDKEIKAIETEMYTTSLSLKREKELIAKIAELRKSKPMVTKYQAMEGSLGPANVDSMRDNITDIKKELDELRDAKKLQNAAYTKLMEARQKVMGDVPKLFEEREKINLAIRERIQQRNTLRDEFNVKQREYQAYQGKVRELRMERANLERAARNEEWAANKAVEAADAGPPALPFAEDLQYLENIMKYLKTHAPKEEEAKKEHKKEIDASAAGKGYAVLKTKDDREEEFFFAPTKKKQLKKKGPATKAKPIVHSMEALSFFDKYKIPTPADSSAIPDAIKATEAKVAEFKAKQEKKVEEEKKKAEKKAKGEKDEEEAPAEAPAADEPE